MKTSRFEIDMIHGPIMPKLFSFFVPLMLSGILQLLFNAVDIIVVGRFSGSQSLAAVGSTTALISLMVNLFIGISLGANVMAARFRATENDTALSEVVHTALTLAGAAGFFMIFVGIFLSRPALMIMGTPDDVIHLSVLYMRIYFCGMPFFMVYNFSAAILRAVGDTKRPLIFLIIAGFCNAVLNLILVTVFHLGVAGVAIATVFSQFVSCMLVLRVLLTVDSAYRFILKKLHINRTYLVMILKIGLPAGIQSMIINVSNALLQSSVNSFGSLAMAGYTAANNLLGFMFISIDSVSQACMNFTSQNYGAGSKERCDATLRDCILIVTGVSLLLGGALALFGTSLLHIYTTDTQAIAAGLEIGSVTFLPYFMCGLMNVVPGAMRGLGHSTVPMILSLIGTVASRVIWIFWIFPLHRTLSFLFISYPLSWALTFMLQMICFLSVRKKVFTS